MRRRDAIAAKGSKLYIPVFYVLAASKTYEAYWNVLQYISDAIGERLVPDQIVCDFEIALIRAVQDWYPDIDFVGCFFHFKQACKRKMEKLFITKPEILIAMEKGVLDMLTVVDREKIGKQGVAWVRAKIKQRCEEKAVRHSAGNWKRFWAYFRKTWLKLLPPEVWNVHGFGRAVVARTNNPLERFNRELNSAFGTAYPPVVKFVQTIEEISRRYVQLRDDIIRGLASHPPRDTNHDLPAPIVLPDECDSSSESAAEDTGDVSDDAVSSDDEDVGEEVSIDYGLSWDDEEGEVNI